MHGSARRLSLAFLVTALAGPLPAPAQQPAAQPLFRSSVDLVSLAAVVRDHQGRVVPTLTRDDFTVLDGGQPRAIVSVDADANAPVSVALLMDGSGSMPRDVAVVQRIGERLLAQLDPRGDEAALMRFDTRLLLLREFTGDFAEVRRGLRELESFGATSIYDAIAGAAGTVARHTRQRRALLVVTDGSDNASAYTPGEVAWIASTIDVPVYVMAVAAAPSWRPDRAPADGGALGALARATGGDYFVADTGTRQQIAIGRVLDELRHQYLIAFEPASSSGMRSLEVRTRNPAMKVRARQWYSAGSD